VSNLTAESTARLVWFLGPSCAGKTTLIGDVAGDLGHPLSLHLARQTPVEVCAASLEVEGRSVLGKTIHDQLRPSLTLLVKGQSSDISSPERRVPRQLAEDLLLDATLSEH
jgi:ABC-type cobalamin transport system ATPase subunit